MGDRNDYSAFVESFTSIERQGYDVLDPRTGEWRHFVVESGRWTSGSSGSVVPGGGGDSLRGSAVGDIVKLTGLHQMRDLVPLIVAGTECDDPETFVRWLYLADMPLDLGSHG